MSQPSTLLPLEVYLQNNGAGIHFPVESINYFERYLSTKAILSDVYYPQIDIVASLMEERTFYTNHGLPHINDIIFCVGELIGVNRATNEIEGGILSPYEVYILLMSILVHDVGMIYGRVGHASQAYKVLTALGAVVGSDGFEINAISKVAKAHSGKLDGTKDTISDLLTYNTTRGCSANLKILSALVRIADEISETKRRASRFALGLERLTLYSKIAQKYASYINAVDFDKSLGLVSIDYGVPVVDIITPITGLVNGVESSLYMVDNICKRIDNMNFERIYCNRYLGGVTYIHEIKVTVRITDDQFDTIDTIPFSIIDAGYPEAGTSVSEIVPKFTGAQMSLKHSAGTTP